MFAIDLILKGIMMSARKRLLALAAVAAMWATLQPGAASAQTIGMGGDGYIRGMWHATDGTINLWKLDPTLNLVGNHAYGPYAGWSPVALTTVPNKECAERYIEAVTCSLEMGSLSWQTSSLIAG